MKLLTLNIWGGHVYHPLLDFMRKHQDIDIFCLQEVYYQAPRKITDEDRQLYLDILTDIKQQLPEHHIYFKPVVDNIYGIAMLVHQSLEVIAEGDVIIHQNSQYPGIGPTHSRNLQWLEFRYKNKNYTVINVHGLWNGQGKTDSPARLLQAKNIKQFLDSVSTAKVLCGDFNLRPDTESLNIIRQEMHDLIKEHNITDTRTSFYNKTERFADYVFTSSDINVEKFRVLPDQVSDHAPLYLEFA